MSGPIPQATAGPNLPAKARSALLSAATSIPYDGGWLDGALGVVAGMGIGAYGLADKKPAKTLYVVGWADEEGVAFGKSCLGSSAVSGIVTSKDVLPLIHRKRPQLQRCLAGIRP